MNQDTNREDRVERAPVARMVKLHVIHGDGSTQTFHPKACLSCGASSDPYGNLPCPCGQPEYSA